MAAASSGVRGQPTATTVDGAILWSPSADFDTLAASPVSKAASIDRLASSFASPGVPVVLPFAFVFGFGFGFDLPLPLPFVASSAASSAYGGGIKFSSTPLSAKATRLRKAAANATAMLGGALMVTSLPPPSALPLLLTCYLNASLSRLTSHSKTSLVTTTM